MSQLDLGLLECRQVDDDDVEVYFESKSLGGQFMAVFRRDPDKQPFGHTSYLKHLLEHAFLKTEPINRVEIVDDSKIRLVTWAIIDREYNEYTQVRRIHKVDSQTRIQDLETSLKKICENALIPLLKCRQCNEQVLVSLNATKLSLSIIRFDNQNIYSIKVDNKPYRSRCHHTDEQCLLASNLGTLLRLKEVSLNCFSYTEEMERIIRALPVNVRFLEVRSQTPYTLEALAHLKDLETLRVSCIRVEELDYFPDLRSLTIASSHSHAALTEICQQRGIVLSFLDAVHTDERARRQRPVFKGRGRSHLQDGNGNRVLWPRE